VDPQRLAERLSRRPTVEPVALVASRAVVVVEEPTYIALDCLRLLISCGLARDVEALVEKRPVHVFGQGRVPPSQS